MVHFSETQTGGAGREFPVTDWGSLLHLRDPNDPVYTRTLERLAERYWKPVYHYVRALRRANVEEAKDLTQQFFTMLLARGDLARLSDERGSFRGFLKTALRNFLVSADRARAARLPGGDARLVGWTGCEDGEGLREPPSPEADPGTVFDREWVRSVLLAAVRDLEILLSSEGKRLRFEIFRDHCGIPQGSSAALDASRWFAALDGASPSYDDLATRYGVSSSDVRNYLHSCRERLRQILRATVRNYVSRDGDVEAELRILLTP